MVRTSRAFWWGALTSIIVGIVAFASGVSVALHWGADLPFAGTLGPTSSVRRASPDNIEKAFEVYWQAWDLIEQEFYRDKPLDHQKMIYASVAGMMQSLQDEYTFFQEPEDASKTREQMEGQFEGIGAYIEYKNDQLIIVAPIEESPAEKAGLLAGDVVVRVNDADLAPQLANLDPDGATKEAVKLIRGPKGSTVKLTILRPSLNQTLEFSIIRDAVPHISVNAKMLDNGVAYLQITQFEGTTTGQLDRALKKLLEQKPSGLVLDLRNNPGGLLDTAQEVLGRFLPGGTALYERFANGQEEEFGVKRGAGAASNFDLPMIVLVNNGSASASEIVAGALSDRGRAVLLGEKSFGKGSVQSVRELVDTSSARITIARWLTPNKHEIHKKGLVPQHYVPFDDNERYRIALPQAKTTDPTEAKDSQLFWALKLLTTGEKPPEVVPTATAVP